MYTYRQGMQAKYKGRYNLFSFLIPDEINKCKGIMLLSYLSFLIRFLIFDCVWILTAILARKFHSLFNSGTNSYVHIIAINQQNLLHFD